MASKSRLGRGLGALFPTLPDEQEFQHEAQAAKPEPTKPEPAKKTTARKAAKKAPSKPSKAATEPKKAPYDPEAYADVDGPISPLSSTIPSMGAMTIHAETVNKLSAPMTLQPQAAEHHAAQQPDRPSSPVKTHGKRATMPAISSMTHHPSDMFFDGTPLADTAKPKEEESEAPELKPVAGGYLVELNPNQIGPNLYQPRTTFNEEQLLREFQASNSSC